MDRDDKPETTTEVKKIWKASELCRLIAHPDWYAQNKEEVEAAKREQRIIYGK